MRQRPGFILADAVFGLLLLAVVGTLLAVALNRHQRVMQRLADERSALRLAERGILAARLKRELPATSADERVALQPLGAVAEADSLRWVRVTATVRGRSAALIGAMEAK